MVKAMILAAGFGTRLRPLTLELPKPLVPVGDRPAIAHIAERLVAGGATGIVVNTHHQAAAFSAEALAFVPGSVAIVTEPEILGTGGGVANAAPLLGEGDVIVWNGDILAPLDVAALRAAHARASERAAARFAGTLAIAAKPRGEGTVGLDASGRVVRLRGERFGDEIRGGDFLGISVIGAELRRALPVPGCLVGDGLLPWLRGGGEVGSFEVAAAWEDIGSVGAYLRANRRWLAETGKDCHVGEGAEIGEGIQVTGSVVGRGATVRGRGRLEGCVVWPGATATAPLSNSVVTTGGLVAEGGEESGGSGAE